jgi:hypothetical protein
MITGEMVEKWCKTNGYEIKKISGSNSKPSDFIGLPYKKEIVYEQIGCTMTIYRFYEIVRKTPKQWVLRELESTKRAGDYYNSYYVKPSDNFRQGSSEFRKSAGSLSIWNGEELHEDHND